MENNVGGKCPICEASITLTDGVLEGELVSCSSCGEDLEVVAIGKKIKFSTAPEIQEDWGE